MNRGMLKLYSLVIVLLVPLYLSAQNNFNFDNNEHYFIQELVYEKYDKTKPYFVLPISSVTHTNIKPLVFALYDLIGFNKNG